MAENISAFAAYNLSNGAPSSKTIGTRKNIKNKSSVPTIKLPINRNKKGSVSKNKKKNQKQAVVNVADAIQNNLVQAFTPVVSTSNGVSNKKKNLNKGRKGANKYNKVKSQSVPNTNSTLQLRSNLERRASTTSAVLNEPTHQQNGQNESSTNHTSIVLNCSINTRNDRGSVEYAEQTLTWLLQPTSVKGFMKNYWEKQLMFIKEKNRDKFKRLVSTELINEMLCKQIFEFTKNIDVTSYRNGVRETHNPEGRAMPYAVWEFYNSGCSIRMLNPQTFFPAIHQLNATLQEYFHCMTGANIYLTPPNSQGFAPHYDDIEALVLQIEGKKRWKLYPPRSDDEKLARDSSGNLQQDEIGEPLFEQILEPGDLLYFPRGTIHQAQTVPGHHSLHITLSFYQKMSFGDLFEQLIPPALQNAIESNIEFRRGVPLNIWNHLGFVHSDSQSEERTRIKAHLKELFSKLLDYVDFDDAVDQMALKYQHDALPPFLSGNELPRTCYGSNIKVASNGKVQENKLRRDTKFRLLRANIIRLVQYTDDQYRLYYHVDNSKEYREYDLNYTELDGEAAMVVEHIIKTYPTFIDIGKTVTDENSLEQNLTVAQELWNRGLLMTAEPIN